MRYGTDGPCTLAEAQEDDEDRVTIRLTPAEVAQIIHADDIPAGTAATMLAAVNASTRRMSHRPGSQSDAQSSAVPVDVPVAARAGEAAHVAFRRGMEQAIARAEKAEAKVARVEALADEADRTKSHFGEVGSGYVFSAQLRAALADPAPVEQQDDEAVTVPTGSRARGGGAW